MNSFPDRLGETVDFAYLLFDVGCPGVPIEHVGGPGDLGFPALIDDCCSG